MYSKTLPYTIMHVWEIFWPNSDGNENDPKIDLPVRKIMQVIPEYQQSLKERDLYHYVSDLIDGHRDFDNPHAHPT